MTGAPVVVVGIGADGWDGLTDPSRTALRTAEVLFGSIRQLALLPDEVTAARLPWPSPMLPALPGLLDTHAGRRIAVLASGDPMFFGVGATLSALLGPERLHVLPHVSSVSLACARLGWPLDDVEVISVVGRPVAAVHPAVHPGRRLLVLSAGASSPAEVAALLTERGYGRSRLTVLSRLGAPDESHVHATAHAWPHPPTDGAGGAAPDPSALDGASGVAPGPRVDALNLVAVECVAGPDATPLPTVPGLPDDAFDHDGQLTKREVRAITLARLAPVPGRLLWDVGAGAGSIAIEWMRAHRSCRAVAVEHRADRAERLAGNAAALGVPGLDVVTGAAPDALVGLPAPDAVFVGGGVTVPGVLDACWDALRPGGRLVVNAVTVESEAVVLDGYGRLGGDLTRIAISRGGPVGGFTGWRAAMPVTQWVVTKR